MSFGVATSSRSIGSEASVIPDAWSAAVWATLVNLTGALALGGASRENGIPAAVVALAGALTLPLVLVGVQHKRLLKGATFTWGLLLAICAVPIAQLIPLPPGIWSNLPGRALVSDVYRALGMDLSWAPLSYAPYLTIRSGLLLAVAIPVFLGALSLSPRQRSLAVWAILTFVIVNLGLGMVQITGGPSSPAYLWPTTNTSSAVGLFANRNHLAALLACSLPLASAVMVTHWRPRSTLAFPLAYLGICTVLILSLSAVESRAGVLLAVPAALASLGILSRQVSRRQRRALHFTFLGSLVCAGAVVYLAGGNALMTRFAATGQDVRLEFGPYVFQAARDFLPLGSGLGSFDTVFRTMEPDALIGSTFINHAHNDYLELLLETGVLGVLVLATFLAWLLSKIWRVWRPGANSDPLGQAAAVVTMILLLHSAVDYPLRTLALSAVFAFACGVLAVPAGEALPLRSRRSAPRKDAAAIVGKWPSGVPD